MNEEREDASVHRILADTDALLAYGRLDCWPTVRSTLAITTTRQCYNELTSHANLDRAARHDPEEQAKKAAAERVLDALDDESSPFGWTYCGESVRTGEESVARLAGQHSDDVQHVLMMDSGSELAQGGRALLRRQLDLDVLDIELPSLGVPIGVLAENGHLSEGEACAAIDQISEREGWRSRGALRRIWEGVPLDCDEEPDFLDG